jgi:hypothetical protein
MWRCGLRLAECAKVFRLPPEREHDTADLDKRAFVADVMERIAEKWQSREREQAPCLARGLALCSAAKDDDHAALHQADRN